MRLSRNFRISKIMNWRSIWTFCCWLRGIWVCNKEGQNSQKRTHNEVVFDIKEINQHREMHITIFFYSNTHTLTKMFIIEPSMAITMMISDWNTKSTTNLKSVIETNRKILHDNMIEWNTLRSWILFRRIEPLKKPIDLQKNRTEYYVYLWPVWAAR